MGRHTLVEKVDCWHQFTLAHFWRSNATMTFLLFGMCLLQNKEIDIAYAIRVQSMVYNKEV
jgi:hypothetical protein